MNVQLAPVQPAARVSRAHVEPGVLRAEAAACRQLWCAVLRQAVRDAASVEELRSYLTSRDGRQVLALAGFEGLNLDRLDLSHDYNRSARKVDEDGRFVRGDVELPAVDPHTWRAAALAAKAAREAQRGKNKVLVMAECDRLHAAGRRVTSGVLALIMPDIPRGSLSGYAVEWRRLRGVAAGPSGRAPKG